MTTKRIDYYVVRFANLATGKFHEMQMNQSQVEILRRTSELFQVLNVDYLRTVTIDSVK